MHERWGADVAFLAVYIREAHPIDGPFPERLTDRWLLGGPQRGVLVENPITDEERLELARECERSLGLPFPVLVDRLDDAVERAYAAWPDRLYLVDLDGSVVYRSRKGPQGFRPDELEGVIEELVQFYTGSER
jgi:hypothetical protein